MNFRIHHTEFMKSAHLQFSLESHKIKIGYKAWDQILCCMNVMSLRSIILFWKMFSIYNPQKTDAKSRRSVVFKKQNYQSVYEYPKENTLSPTMCDSQGWASYLANSSPFSSTMECTYVNSNTADNSTESQIEVFNALDGFAVSSSFRPFHLRQFNTECHTWPTDSEFSWSQLQVSFSSYYIFYSSSFVYFTWSEFCIWQSDHKDDENEKVNYQTDSSVWTKNLHEQTECSSTTDETRDLQSSSSVHRPDSGVEGSVSWMCTITLWFDILLSTFSNANFYWNRLIFRNPFRLENCVILKHHCGSP